MTKHRLKSLIKEALADTSDIEVICRKFSTSVKEFLLDDAVAHNVTIDDDLSYDVERVRAKIANQVHKLVFDEVKNFRQKYNA